jgi:pimeloyl-ACP methyl ester carboxylesterase
MIKDFVTVAGLRTHYWQAGKGPVLLMLHGQLPGSCVAVEWGDQVQRFADAGFSVWAIDEAGFGQTDNPSDWSIEARIAHAQAFVDEVIKPERYHIWGCSMGTLMGCKMALMDPRIDKLVLMPSTLLPPPVPGVPPVTGIIPGSVGELARQYTPTADNARELLKRVLKNPAALSENRVRLLVENSSGKNEEAERKRVEHGRPGPMYEELPDVKNKVLIHWGRDDPNSPLERTILMLRLFPNAEMHVVGPAGHWPQVDQADRTFELVNAYLKS